MTHPTSSTPETAPTTDSADPAEQISPEVADAAAPSGQGSADRAAEIAALQAEVTLLKDKLLRAHAETENVRRRLEQQAVDKGKYAVSAFAKEVLPVADNLRRALDSLPAEARENDPMAQKLAEGVELTERAFLAALERHGIKRLQVLGERFDPHLHQAMMEVEDPGKPAGTVVLEMQTGYTIHDRLLREAMVGVAKGGPKPHPGDAGVDTIA